MTVYGNFTATARSLITEKGQLITWNQRSATSASQEFVPNASTVTTYSVRMVFFNLNYRLTDFFAPRGSLIGYMSPFPVFIPSVNDYVTRDGRDLVVNKIDEISPNGEIIYYVVEFN